MHFHGRKLIVSIASVLIMVFVLLSFSLVMAEEPDTEMLYREGMYLREKGDFYAAIEAFHSILSAQPNLHRVRLEMAVTYYRMMNYEEARRQAESVLQDPKIPESVRLSILAFLAQNKKDEEEFYAKRHVLEPSVSFGLLYDTNVNAGPTDDIIQVGDLTLTLTPDSLELNDWAAFLSAGLVHRYQFPGLFQAGDKIGRFLWISQANAYRKQYFREEDYNLDVLSLSTGPSLLVLQSFRANIAGRVDYLRLGDSELAWYLSLGPSISWQFANGELTWDGLLLKRDFTRDEDDGRDSAYTATGLYYGHLFNQGKFAIQIGGRLFKENADSRRFSNDGTEILAGANMATWPNGALYANAGMKNIDYDGKEPVFNKTRDEEEYRLEVGITHDFKETVLNGWRLTGSFEYTDNQSNVSIYDYRRKVTMISMNRTF